MRDFGCLTDWEAPLELRSIRSEENGMNKGRFKTLAIATLSAIALVASIAVAQTGNTQQDNTQGARPEWRGRGRGDHKGHGMRGMRAGGFFKQLNLTEDQQAKMKQ